MLVDIKGVPPKLSPITSDTTSSIVEIAEPSFKLYTVRRGDSLWAISKRENVSLEDLYSVNGLDKASVIKVGQEVRIPVEGSTATINTITADAYQPSGFNTKTETYVVAKGDTLSKIARKFNIPVKTIKAANNKQSDTILVREKLIIPVYGSTSSNPSSNAAYTSNNKAASVGDYAEHIVK